MEEFWNDKSLNPPLHDPIISTTNIHTPEYPQNFQDYFLPILPNNNNISIGHQYDHIPNIGSLNPYPFQPINICPMSQNQLSNVSTNNYNSTTMNVTNYPQNPIYPPFSYPNQNHPIPSLMTFNSETHMNHISNMPIDTYPLNHYLRENSTTTVDKAKRETRLVKSREAADRARAKKKENLNRMETAVGRGKEEIKILLKDIDEVKKQLKPYQDRRERINKHRPIERSRSL